ncbi:hypothetical protein, partial [Bacteroides uniformis]|uniref:hypothetical protein n=1 Tax=Bacteroides uniformis TaxID=820 RepID=UPI001AA189AF
EVPLGECGFGGSNQLQIHKFHLGWKVDIQGFPTSYPELNLDTRKPFKSGAEVGAALFTLGLLFLPTFCVS